MMRLRTDIDQKILAELFYQYLNVEEDFIRELFTNGETQLGRTFVHEPVLSFENALTVLDYERAGEVIRTAKAIGVGLCYCRHRMEHLDRACGAPMDICLTFNTTAASLIRHGVARKMDAAEGMDLLQKAYDHNLVQFGENVRDRVNFICNCCGCWKCVHVCPVEALGLVSANHPGKPSKKKARLNADICLGCGLCVKACPKKMIKLVSREQRVITPVNGAHRALAAVFGVILGLPPLKRALASGQVKSRYLETLIRRRYS
ncbi:MAG: 4Fe-4S dicluster domain-containing protein [Acidobacteria bacterium]|nr:4Fe-4S dicluster domain-containing protein [Acidobacteriota bacterium]